MSRSLKPGNEASRAITSEIRVVEGTIEVRDRPRLKIETLANVDVSLAWPSISRSFGATGSFSWRGERIDGSLTLSDFYAALTGERSGVKIRVASPMIKGGFDGSASYVPAVKIEGVVSADSPSLRRAVNWASHKTLPGTGFERFSMKAQTSVLGHTVALSNVNIDLDGNAAEGVLTLTGSKRMLLQGTLAANEINLTPYIGGVVLRDGDQRGWSRAPLSFDGFDSIDFDLRLSASRAILAGTRAGRSALGATLREGRLSVSIGESQAFGGLVRGQISLAPHASGAEMRGQLQLTDVDLDDGLGTVFGIRRLEGRGDLTLALEGSGRSVEALTHSLNGTATLKAQKGFVTGLNVEQMLRRLERRPLSGWAISATGAHRSRTSR